MVSYQDLSFEAAFPEPVTIGSIVTVAGKFKLESLSFVLNLVCRPSEEIALHCSFHFNERKVVRKHSTPSSGWAEEELDGGWPIKASGEFEISIEIDEDVFKMFVYDKLFARFRHHMPYSKITHVNGSAGADFTSIKFEKKENKLTF